MEKFRPLSQSEQLDGDEEAAILTLLLSSDAESSLDDDHSDDDPSSDKTISPDPLPGDTSIWKAAANMVNFMEGVGFLALPYAIKQGGIAAVVFFILIPASLWYTGNVLIDCFYDVDAQGRKVRVRFTFKDLGDVLSPKYGGYIVSVIAFFELFLLSVSYLIICGSIMYHALPSVPIQEIQWTCIAVTVVLPTTFLKSLSQIAWLSTISVFALITAAVTVVWYGAQHALEWDLDSILFWDTAGAINSMFIILYSYAAYFIFPSVEASMSDKSQFSKALGCAYVVSALMKVFFSLFGFLSFGFNTDELVLNNLPPGPVHITVSSFFVLSCIFSYVLALYPVIESADSFTTCIQNDKIPNFVMYAVVRISLVFLTAIVAILVPHFVVIISLLASTAGLFVSYIFPTVLRLKLKYNQLKVHQVFVDVSLVVFGVIATVVGTTFSVMGMIEVH